jgi:hypothetical protein
MTDSHESDDSTRTTSTDTHSTPPSSVDGRRPSLGDLGVTAVAMGLAWLYTVALGVPDQLRQVTIGVEYVTALGPELGSAVASGILAALAIGPAAMVVRHVVCPRWEITRPRRQFVVAWTLGVAVPVLVVLVAAAVANLGDITTSIEDGTFVSELLNMGRYVVGAAFFPAVFTVAAEYATRHGLDVREWSRPAVAVAVLLVAAFVVPTGAAAVLAADSWQTSGESSPLADDTNLANVSAYDDGHYGPDAEDAYADGDLVRVPSPEGLRVTQPTRGGNIQSTPATFYAPVETHYAPSRFTFKGYRVAANQTPVRGHYYATFTAPNATHSRIIEIGLYDTSPVDGATETATHIWRLYTMNGTAYELVLERTAAGTLYVDVIEPNGEVHRYIVRVERTDLNATATDS